MTSHLFGQPVRGTRWFLSRMFSGLIAGSIYAAIFIGAPALAGTADVILECSASATDERGIDACLSVTLEQAEAAVSTAEQSLMKLLEAEEQHVPANQNQESQNDGSAAADEALVTQTNATDTAPGPKVIAIVNDVALESGLDRQRGVEILNIDDDAYEEESEPLVNLSIDIKERFGFLPALYRSYRDQHCAWQATMFGQERTDQHYKACLTDQNRSRAAELNRSLAEIRSMAKGGRNSKGFYVRTNNGATFQACDRKVDWWVTGSDAVLAALDRRYADASTREIAVTAGKLIYAELTGTVDTAPETGPGADYGAAFRVQKINILRPLSPKDCVVSPLTQNNDPADTVQSAATVDDYASAGFIYGYFNYWLSACSVTENSVCSAETDAQFASDGDWKLRVDRSLEGDWRIQLIPTTNDEVIEKELMLSVDGDEVYLPTVFSQPMQLRLNKGVDVAEGDMARELVMRLRSGRESRFAWRDESGVMSELKFSLLGVTRALQFFDQSIR